MINYKNSLKELTRLTMKKILIMDGAMGTEIQKLNMNEDDFRGKRFSK